MANYRSIVHYHFKEGQEKAALKMIERELSKHTGTPGCVGFEIVQNEREPGRILGIAIWNSLEDAQAFQALWKNVENDLAQLSAQRPHHEFFRITKTIDTKHRKAA